MSQFTANPGYDTSKRNDPSKETPTLAHVRQLTSRPRLTCCGSFASKRADSRDDVLECRVAAAGFLRFAKRTVNYRALFGKRCQMRRKKLCEVYSLLGQTLRWIDTTKRVVVDGRVGSR
jgi:hypothetical protein